MLDVVLFDVVFEAFIDDQNFVFFGGFVGGVVFLSKDVSAFGEDLISVVSSDFFCFGISGFFVGVNFFLLAVVHF